MRIAFTIDTIPIAQPRQRHRQIKTHDGRNFIRNYTPTKAPVNAFKASIQMGLRMHWSGALERQTIRGLYRIDGDLRPATATDQNVETQAHATGTAREKTGYRQSAKVFEGCANGAPLA
jgi:hypothetical protein